MFSKGVVKQRTRFSLFRGKIQHDVVCRIIYSDFQSRRTNEGGYGFEITLSYTNERHVLSTFPAGTRNRPI